MQSNPECPGRAGPRIICTLKRSKFASPPQMNHLLIGQWGLAITQLLPLAEHAFAALLSPMHPRWESLGPRAQHS